MCLLDTEFFNKIYWKRTFRVILIVNEKSMIASNAIMTIQGSVFADHIVSPLLMLTNKLEGM